MSLVSISLCDLHCIRGMGLIRLFDLLGTYNPRYTDQEHLMTIVLY